MYFPGRRSREFSVREWSLASCKPIPPPPAAVSPRTVDLPVSSLMARNWKPVPGHCREHLFRMRSYVSTPKLAAWPAKASTFSMMLSIQGLPGWGIKLNRTTLDRCVSLRLIVTVHTFAVASEPRPPKSNTLGFPEMRKSKGEGRSRFSVPWADGSTVTALRQSELTVALKSAPFSESTKMVVLVKSSSSSSGRSASCVRGKVTMPLVTLTSRRTAISECLQE